MTVNGKCGSFAQLRKVSSSSIRAGATAPRFQIPSAALNALLTATYENHALLTHLAFNMLTPVLGYWYQRGAVWKSTPTRKASAWTLLSAAAHHVSAFRYPSFSGVSIHQESNLSNSLRP